MSDSGEGKTPWDVIRKKKKKTLRVTSLKREPEVEHQEESGRSGGWEEPEQ